MKFPNAYAGVKKIFTAEILSLIAAVCSTIALALTATTLIAAASDNETGTLASIGGLAVFGVAVIVLAIIAFILQLVGTINGSKDESAFRIAMFLIIAGIVISGASSFFSNNATAKSILTILSDAVSLGVTVYIIQAIKNLAERLTNSEMMAKGDNIFKIILIIYALIIIARIITLIFQNTAGVVAAVVFIVIAGILEVVQYVLYLMYLAKAKKMLA